MTHLRTYCHVHTYICAHALGSSSNHNHQFHLGNTISIKHYKIAFKQVITYSEYLPQLLGEDLMNDYELPLGLPESYNAEINPSTTNVFATAAFRYGHSLIGFGFQPKNKYVK